MLWYMPRRICFVFNRLLNRISFSIAFLVACKICPAFCFIPKRAWNEVFFVSFIDSFRFAWRFSAERRKKSIEQTKSAQFHVRSRNESLQPWVLCKMRHHNDILRHNNFLQRTLHSLLQTKKDDGEWHAKEE